MTLRLLAASLVVASATIAVAAAQAPAALARGRVTYFIGEGAAASQYRASDRDLARWALDAWQRTLNGAISFEPAPEAAATVRIRWVGANAGEYGETRPTIVNGHRGAVVLIRPDTSALGPDIARLADADPLMRDAIVYLTCLHELGHALGLAHTADPRDIMFFFGYGGDIPEFFGRYRRQLRTRDDIARVPGLSGSDVARVRALYGVRVD